jgi:phage/plasmid-associated DNA primase
MTDFSLPDFCDSHDIKWFPISLTITSETEPKIFNQINHPLYAEVDIHDFSNADLLRKRQALLKSPAFKSQFTHITMDSSKVMQIDIDTADYEDKYDTIAWNTPYYKSARKSYGKHLLITSPDFIPDSKKMQFHRDGETTPCNVELLCGFGCYAPLTGLVNANKPILEISKQDLERGLIMKQKRPKSPTSVVSSSSPDSNKITEMCGIIDDKYICAKGCYNDWRNILWALRSESEDYKEIARELSMRSRDLYDEDIFERVWDSFKGGNITISSLYYYAKESNPLAFREINQKYSPPFYISTNDVDDLVRCSEIIAPEMKKILKLCKEQWFLLNEETQLWERVKEPFYAIMRMIRKFIDFSQLKNSRMIMIADGAEKEKLIKIQETYMKQYKTINGSGYASQIVKSLRGQLIDNKFEDKLNCNQYQLAFKNGMMDLKTGVFRHGLQWDDYLTQTIPYDWSAANADKKKFLKNVLKKILNNNDEHLEYFLSVLGFSFLGMPHLEKSMYFMIDGTDGGKGDNGKTFYFDILCELMPNYVYKAQKSLLEEGNSKVHKQLCMTKGMRLVWLEEFSKDKELASTLMKCIAEGKPIENEIMYGTSESINVLFKAFILSNHIPSIDPNEEAVYNRYKQITFGSHFDRTGMRKTENADRLQFIANIELGDLIKREYYNEVFELIIEYAKKYTERKMVAIPEKFKNDAAQTKLENDSFRMWFDEHCEFDEDGRVPKEWIVKESKITDKEVIRGMTRLGLKFNKEMKGMGCKPFSKEYYKGGFAGCKIKQVEVEVSTDDEEE